MAYWDGRHAEFEYAGTTWKLSWWPKDTEKHAVARDRHYAVTCQLAADVPGKDGEDALRARMDDICLGLSIMTRGTVKVARFKILAGGKEKQRCDLKVGGMAGFWLAARPHQEKGPRCPGPFLQWAMPRLEAVKGRVRLSLLSYLLATATESGIGVEAMRVTLASCLEVIRHDYLSRVLVPKKIVKKGHRPDSFDWVDPPSGLNPGDSVGLASVHRHLATSLGFDGVSKQDTFWAWLKNWRNDALHDPGIDPARLRAEIDAVLVVVDYIDALVFAMLEWDLAEGWVSCNGRERPVLGRVQFQRSPPRTPIVSFDNKPK